jgi:hypothetical protein
MGASEDKDADVLDDLQAVCRGALALEVENQRVEISPG